MSHQHRGYVLVGDGHVNRRQVGHLAVAARSIGVNDPVQTDSPDASDSYGAAYLQRGIRPFVGRVEPREAGRRGARDKGRAGGPGDMEGSRATVHIGGETATGIRVYLRRDTNGQLCAGQCGAPGASGEGIAFAIEIDRIDRTAAYRVCHRNVGAGESLVAADKARTDTVRAGEGRLAVHLNHRIDTRGRHDVCGELANLIRTSDFGGQPPQYILKVKTVKRRHIRWTYFVSDARKMVAFEEAVVYCANLQRLRRIPVGCAKVQRGDLGVDEAGTRGIELPPPRFNLMPALIIKQVLDIHRHRPGRLATE